MLGARCEQFRINFLGMTRKQFSEKTGLSVSQIRHFEQGRSRNMNILMAYMKFGFEI